MKNSIVILFLLLLSQLGYGQGRTFKVTARPWVKGQKDLPWKEYDTRTIAQLDGFKATDKVHVNEYGSDWDAPKHRATGFFRVRSEERRVGKECLRLCRSRWSPYH